MTIGRAMEGKRLHPNILKKLPGEPGSIIPGHDVTVRHISKSVQPYPGNHYFIEIRGPALAGGWPFFSGELEPLARASVGSVDRDG